MAYFTPEAAAMMSSSSDAPVQKNQTTWEYMTNRRSRKQASLFFLGATLFTFSTLIAKRATLFRQRATYPLFYKPSNVAPSPVDGRVEAIQALQLATMTTVSGTIMVGGGLLWAFDISTVDDLRARIRGAVHAPASGPSERQRDKEFEEWLADTMAKRKAKEEAENVKLTKEPGQKD